MFVLEKQGITTNAVWYYIISVEQTVPLHKRLAIKWYRDSGGKALHWMEVNGQLCSPAALSQGKAIPTRD